MKSRKGFVSNSSSSSFIIGINKTTDENVIPFFEVAIKLFQDWDVKYEKEKSCFLERDEYLESMREELIELKDDIKYCDEKIVEFNKYLAQDELKEMINKIASAQANENVPLRSLRKYSNYSFDVFESTISNLTREKRIREEKIIDNEKIIKEIESSDYEFLVDIEFSNGFGGISDKITALKESGIITIIRKTMT